MTQNSQNGTRFSGFRVPFWLFVPFWRREGAGSGAELGWTRGVGSEREWERGRE